MITAPEAAPNAPDLLTLEVPGDMDVAGLKASIEQDSGYPTTSQHLYHNGRLLDNANSTLGEYHIENEDMLMLHVRDMVGQTGIPESAPRAPRIQPQRQQRGGGEGEPDSEMIRLQLLGDPTMLSQIRTQNPQLAAVVNDPSAFREQFNAIHRQRQEMENARQRETQALYDDPFNPENQARIEEMIRQEAVMENLQNAIEHNPEGQ
jgi:DNA damage-inducible protein 1